MKGFHEAHGGLTLAAACKLCILLAAASLFAISPSPARAQEDTQAATDNPGTITGRVLDAAGAPVADFQVVLEGTRDHRSTTHTDAEGHYAFEDLPPGNYRVSAALAASTARTEKPVRLAAGGTTETTLRLAWLLQDSVTVSGTVTRELTQVPGGTALITSEDLDETRRHNMEDVLYFVPGVIARSRWGADETQLSVRGSGLRNNFHHRGLNLLINGVVYQDADGFGDFETLDLMATERVEVWKGANALRYGGNTLGGAVNFVTYSGETASQLEAALTGGSFGLGKAQVSSGDTFGNASYYISASQTELDGYRDHSEQERTRVFSNVRWDVRDNLEVWTDVIFADVYEKLPGALTREEFESDPTRANPSNLVQDSGRFYDYGRLGFGLRRFFGQRQSLEATVFGQVRNVDHPIFQVLDQDQRTFGAELRYSYEAPGSSRFQRLVVGVAPQFGNNDERRFVNVNGEPGDLVGEFGADAENLGVYLETELAMSSRATLLLGGRWDRAERTYDDRFLADGDRSDELSYNAFSPKIGMLWQAGSNVEVFGNVSRAYEPPLILELTSFGAPGFLDLEAQDAWQLEIGTRGRARSGVSWEASLYDIEIDDEIVNESVQPFPGAPFTVPTYRNVAQTRHRGLELGLAAPFARGLFADGDRLSGQLVYTWSDFTFVDDPIHGDNDLPGAPNHVVRAEIRYQHPSGAWIAPNLDWSPSGYFVDSANTVENDAYSAIHLRGGYDWDHLGLFVEIDNLTDKLYSASVQVDSADGRFFEPADERSFAVGLRWRR